MQYCDFWWSSAFCLFISQVPFVPRILLSVFYPKLGKDLFLQILKLEVSIKSFHLTSKTQKSFIYVLSQITFVFLKSYCRQRILI